MMGLQLGLFCMQKSSSSEFNNTAPQPKAIDDGSDWKIALASFGSSPEAKERTIELSKELNALNIVNTRPAKASSGYYMVVSDTVYTSENVASDTALQLEQKFSKAGIRLDANAKKSSEILN